MKSIYTKLPAIVVLLMTFTFSNTYATKFVVTVANFAFAPTSIPNVAVGDTIRWEWISGTHTTTSTTIPAAAATWNSSITSTATSYEYKVTVAGVYNYKCTPHAVSMGMVASFTATDFTGITDVPSVFGNLQLSPNPASEYVNVSFSPINSFKGTIKLFDLLGKNVWKNETIFNSGPNQTEISLSSIPKGVYFVELSDGRNNKVIRRLIIR